MSTKTPEATTEQGLQRREVLTQIGTALLLVPLAKLAACGDDAGSSSGSGSDSGDDSSGSSEDDTSSGSSDSGDTSDTSGDSDTSTGSATAWATGGVAAMTAIANYPDPFGSDAATSCEVSCETTIGPCHTTSPERIDISEDWNGIPVRLALRILDDDCNPIENAIVELWQTNYKGIYSGNISDMCNTDAADKADDYFRGYTTTDSDGIVYFNTCFPGWYSSRVVHIHFRIMKGTYDGSDSATAWLITQFGWPDDVITDIFTNYSPYKEFGVPDTLFGTGQDTVFGGVADTSLYCFDVQRMTDGAMLASKTLIIRGALSDSVCEAQVSSGSGGSSGGPGGSGGSGGPP